jgi:hypothetical protein
MYHKGLLASTGAGAAALPFTGLNIGWVVIGAFALLMAAGAIWRMVPRAQA